MTDPTGNGAATTITDVSTQGQKIPRKQVISWAFWDWATQPFNTVILTFVFASLYLDAAFSRFDGVKESVLSGQYGEKAGE